MSLGSLGPRAGRLRLHHSSPRAKTPSSPKDRFFACFNKRHVATASLPIARDDDLSTLEKSEGTKYPALRRRVPRDVVLVNRMPNREAKKSTRSQKSFRPVNNLKIRRLESETRNKRRFLTKLEMLAFRKTLETVSQDTPDNKNVTVKQMGKRRKKNRDYLLDRGQLSYDWRVPLAQLRRYASSTDAVRDTSDYLEVTYDKSHLQNVKAEHEQFRSVRADDIPLPPILNKKAFAVHVYNLVNSYVPSSHSYRLYGEGTDHRNATRDKLMSLFEDNSMKSYYSRTAFNTAISYLQRQSFVSDSRQLFIQMSEEHFAPSRETFHIMFRDIARKKNLHAFSVLLRIMIKKSILPDAHTWQYFFQCLDSKLVKTLVYEHMRSLQLLDDLAVLRTVTTELAAIDCESLVEKGGKLSDLIFDYDQRFGKRWFSTSAANSLSNVLALHGRFHESFELLELLEDRQCKPDKATLRILLLNLKRIGKGGDIYAAIETVRVMTNVYKVEPDANILETLFLMGWVLTRPNWCRAVWHVACLKAEVSQKISHKIMKGLVFVPDQTDNLGRWPHFLSYGCKIVAGAAQSDLHVGAWQQFKEVLDQDDRGERLTEAARQLRGSNLEMSYEHEYKGDLAALLREAIELDKQWVNDERYKAGNIDWMLGNAIKIPRASRVNNSIVEI